MDSPYSRSWRELRRGQRVNSGLVARSGVLANGFLDDMEEDFPVVARCARGAYVWDVDGRRYVDLLLGFGSVILGHNEAAVTAAVQGAMEKGVSPTLTCEEEIALAERLVALLPNVEMCAFLRTGSDATSFAVRLARAITGCKTVLRWGYHGWHDWCAPRDAGTVPALRDKTRPFRYNDLDDLESCLKAAKGDTACVIMMPFEVERPGDTYLQEVRLLCDRYNTLLVFDEIRSGFRIAMGGAQQFFSVDADLVCLSKALANGHPISVVGGRRELMRHHAQISASSVFFRGRDGFAAALATLDRLETAHAAGELLSISHDLCAQFDRAIENSSLPVERCGFEVMPFIRWMTGSAEEDARNMRLLCRLLLEAGVLVHPTHHWFTCLSQSREDARHVGLALKGALDRMAV